MDELGFERVDDTLRERLRSAAPPSGDADAVLDAIRPRLAHARRRHRAVVAAGSGMAVAAVLAVSLVMIGPGSERVVTPPASRSRDTTATTTRVPTTAPEGSSVTSTSSPDSSLPSTSSPTGTPAPGATTQTFTSTGGSITVRLADGALSLLSSQPAPGFTEERRDVEPTRVEVRFRAGTEWRIRVDLENGVMVPTISQS